MIDKILEYCKMNHSFVYEKGFSIYELVLKLLEKVNELVDQVNLFETQLGAKEDSQNITSSRKLSETGDFTGSLNGTPVGTVLTNVDSNTDKIQFLTNQFDEGQTGLVVDGGFFLDDDINKSYDGGVW